MVRAGDLKDNPANWRRHPPGQLSALRNLIADPEVGWAAPLLYNERTKRLIDGHARKRIVGPDEFVPVLIGSWSEEAEKKILATLDPLAGMAEADPAALQALLAEVDLAGPDLEALAADLNELLAEAEAGGGEGPPIVEDEPPEPPEKAVSRTGDLWILGEHRVLCGDARITDDVTRLMDGRNPFIMVTDPPYGVAYGDIVRSRVNQKKAGWDDIENDSLSEAELESLLTASLGATGAVVAFVWHPAGSKRWCFWRALEANGWKISQEIVWVKNALVFGRADYQWRHEPCMYAKRDGAPRQNDRTQTTVWEINKPSDSQHPTQKPVECMARPIRNHGGKGDDVYDPFLGSGTTMIAAEQLGRRCYGMEIEPRYVDVAVRRWETFTGKEAVLEKTGKTFAEVAKSRGAG